VIVTASPRDRDGEHQVGQAGHAFPGIAGGLGLIVACEVALAYAIAVVVPSPTARGG
jgi:hypothetical protein